MNAVFTVIFLGSAAALAVFNPEGFLPALLSGGRKALETGATALPRLQKAVQNPKPRRY